jgi:type IV pilus assembly protein PilN
MMHATTPIRINLLPHRAARREQRKREFLLVLLASAIAGALAVFAGGVAMDQLLEQQGRRNQFIKAENQRLDTQIAEIRTLREEITALRARQQAVENLQSDRTLPVRLFDEFSRLTPEGVQLRQLRQDERRVTLSGHAQTNERVAEFLRNLSERSPWLERPELGEIKEITLPAPPGAKDREREARKVFEFSLNALIRRADAPGAR